MSPPIKKSSKINSPELDFDDMESITANIPKARAIELIRLREENTELKDKLMLIRN